MGSARKPLVDCSRRPSFLEVVMHLSDAIRLGSSLRQQAIGRWSLQGTCAIGAAIEAIGGKLAKYPVTTTWPDDVFKYRDAVARWPILDHRIEEFCGTLGDKIVHLNDHKRWTRLQIADYVEEMELRLGYRTAPSLPVVVEEDVFAFA
jgi:hypothetical protein